ncbi:hypothetical protein VNO78_26888 [Psophocarpus tetragonolobus]|uniref:Uncharacterized protein n=1 Tax=Psophocarpus tetragonolobus TaxID=3891 RepID=A0AAN9RZV7_PSOTE
MARTYVQKMKEKGCSFVTQNKLHQKGIFGIRAIPMRVNMVLLESDDAKDIKECINGAIEWTMTLIPFWLNINFGALRRKTLTGWDHDDITKHVPISNSNYKTKISENGILDSPPKPCNRCRELNLFKPGVEGNLVDGLEVSLSPLCEESITTLLYDHCQWSFVKFGEYHKSYQVGEWRAHCRRNIHGSDLGHLFHHSSSPLVVYQPSSYPRDLILNSNPQR